MTRAKNDIDNGFGLPSCTLRDYYFVQKICQFFVSYHVWSLDMVLYAHLGIVWGLLCECIAMWISGWWTCEGLRDSIGLTMSKWIEGLNVVRAKGT